MNTLPKLAKRPAPISPAQKIVNLEQTIETICAERRHLSACLKYWQHFAADLSHILGCAAIDNDILKAVKNLRAEKRLT